MTTKTTPSTPLYLKMWYLVGSTYSTINQIKPINNQNSSNLNFKYIYWIIILNAFVYSP